MGDFSPSALQRVDHRAIEPVLHLVQQVLARARLPRPPDPVGRQAAGPGERRHFAVEECLVHGVIVIGQKQQAEMAGQIVLVGDQDPDDRGIILVGETRISVDVAQVLMLELLHQLDQLRVDVVETPDDALGPRDLVPAPRDAVARLDLPEIVHIEPDVDSLVLETLDPVVDRIERSPVEVPGIPGVAAEDIRSDPVRFVPLDSHDVVSELGDPPRLAGDVVPWRPEKRGAGQVGTPETCGTSVLEDKPIAVCLDEAVTAGRPVVGVEERQVDRRGIPPQRIAKPAAVGLEYFSAAVALIRPPSGRVTVRLIRPRPGRMRSPTKCVRTSFCLSWSKKSLASGSSKRTISSWPTATGQRATGLVQQQLGFPDLATKRRRIQIQRSSSCRPRRCWKTPWPRQSPDRLAAHGVRQAGPIPEPFKPSPSTAPLIRTKLSVRVVTLRCAPAELSP